MADELTTEMRGLLSVCGTEVNTSTSSNATDSAQENEELVVGTDANDTEEPLFEVVIAHGKGLGLFATRNISRGTRIIIEAPLLAVPPRQGDRLNLTHLETALRALNHEQYDKVFELHRGNMVTSANARTVLSQQAQELSGASRRAEILDTIAIFLTNQVEMGPGGCYGSGIFEHYSRINHACNPNVHNSCNPLLEKLTVHATRKINKGDEILTSYIDGTCYTRDRRQVDLGHWGFECGCECCIGPKVAASERRRSKMSMLKQRLAELQAVNAEMPEPPVPGNPQAAPKLCESLLELYRVEGITDYNLAMLYRELSRFSLESGQFDNAVYYAKKECAVERYCLGTEISPRVKGADWWIRNVLAQRKVAEKRLKEKVAVEMEMAQPKKKGGKEQKKGGNGKKKGGKGKKKGGKKKKNGKGKKK